MKFTVARALFPALAAMAVILLWAGPAPGRKAHRDEGVRAQAPAGAYAGSEACLDCHQREHASWAATLKARFVRRAPAPEPIPGDWDRAPFAREQAVLVVGLKYKTAYVDAAWKVLPFEYDLRKHAWKEKPNWRGRDYRVQCGPCHLTGSDPGGPRFSALGVGCEVCHGPGARHVADGGAEAIGVPADTDARGVPALCRRCHNARNRHADALSAWSPPYHK